MESEEGPHPAAPGGGTQKGFVRKGGGGGREGGVAAATPGPWVWALRGRVRPGLLPVFLTLVLWGWRSGETGEVVDEEEKGKAKGQEAGF